MDAHTEWTVVELGDDRPKLAVRLGSFEGRPTFTGVLVLDERGVGTRDLQDLRLGDLLESMVEPPPAPASDYSPRDRRPYDDEHFRWVADQYRYAVARSPRNPLSILREAIPGKSDATIRRWVQRARDKGYLGEGVAGRAGEAVEVSESLFTVVHDPERAKLLARVLFGEEPPT